MTLGSRARARIVLEKLQDEGFCFHLRLTLGSDRPIPPAVQDILDLAGPDLYRLIVEDDALFAHALRPFGED